MRNEAESPVPTPVLTGSGSTGLLNQHLRQCHPAGGLDGSTNIVLGRGHEYYPWESVKLTI